jgi:RNA polymerase sigma factor (sigma-70 family)
MPATALRVPLPRVRLGRLSDDRLASLAASGDERPFEVLYDRHHAALLGFCRHMLGSREEGEDALQQTFLRAHRALLLHGPPEDVRPWLFTIARNRCRSIHAARKDAASPNDQLEPATDGLAADVEQRSDLRALLGDIEQLPEDQRSALVLAELADMPHAEIGAVIGVPASKVKALVHQARTHLIAERDARETPCEQIREQLANARGGELRRGPLRRHLNSCEPCSAYRKAVADQRIALGLLLPVIPSAGLKDAVLGAIGAGGGGGAAAAAAGGTAGAVTAASGGGGTAVGLGAKLAIGAALLGGAGGSAAIVETAVVDHPDAAAAKNRAPLASAHGPAGAAKTHGKVKLVDGSTGAAKRTAAGKSEAARGDKAAEKPGKRKAHAYGRHRNGNSGRRNHGASAEQNSGGQGLALGRNGQAGTRGSSRSAEIQQRNADRKAAKVQEKPVRTSEPKTVAPRSTSPQGTAKTKTAPVETVPVATPAPVVTQAPEHASSQGKSERKGPVDPVTETLTP